MGGKRGVWEAFMAANQSESIRGKAALAPFTVNAFPGIICLSLALCLQSEPTWRYWGTLSFQIPTNIPRWASCVWCFVTLKTESLQCLHFTEFNGKKIKKILLWYYHQMMFNELCTSGGWFKHEDKFRQSCRDHRHCGAIVIYSKTKCRWKIQIILLYILELWFSVQTLCLSGLDQQVSLY